MAPVKSPTLYIDRKPYFLEAEPIATKFPPLGLHLQMGGLIYSTKNLQGGRGQGATAYQGSPPFWAAIRLPLPPVAAGTVATASPSWGDTSSCSSTTPLHHPHCNLLANKIFDVIYYYHMIYCIAMSSIG
jgi:hypothetical protein